MKAEPKVLSPIKKHKKGIKNPWKYVIFKGKMWRRKRDSNPRAFWANGFQDRLVVTASIFLRGARCKSHITPI